MLHSLVVGLVLVGLVSSLGAQGPGTKVTVDDDFPFTWYLVVVERRVRNNWTPDGVGPIRPVIVFEIDRSGRVLTVSIERSSGHSAFDRSAERAVLAAAPFPPLPPDFKGPVLRVHLELDTR